MGKQEKGFDILSEIEIHLFLYYVRKSLTYGNQWCRKIYHNIMRVVMKNESNSNFDLSNCASVSFSSSFTSYWYLLQTIHNSLCKNVGCLFYKDFKIKNLTQCFYHAINSFMVKLMECKDIKSMITFWMVKTFNHNYHIRLFFHNT